MPGKCFSQGLLSRSVAKINLMVVTLGHFGWFAGDICQGILGNKRLVGLIGG